MKIRRIDERHKTMEKKKLRILLEVITHGRRRSPSSKDRRKAVIDDVAAG